MQAQLYAALHAQTSRRGCRASSQAQPPFRLIHSTAHRCCTYPPLEVVMKTAVSLLAVGLVLLAGCGSSNLASNSGPNVTLRLEQVNTPPDVFYFSGPVSIQYRVTINNPTDQSLTLSRLELETLGPGAYSVHTSATPMNLKVAPNATTSYMISVWGRARGGYLTAGEPVTMRVIAYFQGPSGSFVRMFNQNISPLGS
jgi:hypothetical protein